MTKINEGAGDLDAMQDEVVPTARIEDIQRMLEEIAITCQPIDDLIDKLDNDLKDIDKEFNAMKVKARNGSLADCGDKLDLSDDAIKKLADKVGDVN